MGPLGFQTSSQIETPTGVVDLDGEWVWLPFYDALSGAVGQTVGVDTPREVLVELAETHDVPVKPEWNAGKIAMEIFGASTCADMSVSM